MALSTTRKRPRVRRPRKKEKRPEFVAFLLGPHIYRNRFHEACSFAIDSPPGAANPLDPQPFVAEVNLFIKKERFDDLKSRIMNDEFTPETPGCIATAGGTNWGFRGLPRLIAHEEDTQEGFTGVLVKLRYRVTDIKRVNP